MVLSFLEGKERWVRWLGKEETMAVVVGEESTVVALPFGAEEDEMEVRSRCGRHRGATPGRGSVRVLSTVRRHGQGGLAKKEAGRSVAGLGAPSGVTAWRAHKRRCDRGTRREVAVVAAKAGSAGFGVARLGPWEASGVDVEHIHAVMRRLATTSRVATVGGRGVA